MKSDTLPSASPPSSPLNQYAGCKLPAVSRCGSSSNPTRSPLHNTTVSFCLVRTFLIGKKKLDLFINRELQKVIDYNPFKLEILDTDFSAMIIYPPQLQPEMYPILLCLQ